jgi:hypothetical protein
VSGYNLYVGDARKGQNKDPVAWSAGKWHSAFLYPPYYTMLYEEVKQNVINGSLCRNIICRARVAGGARVSGRLAVYQLHLGSKVIRYCVYVCCGCILKKKVFKSDFPYRFQVSFTDFVIFSLLPHQ